MARPLRYNLTPQQEAATTMLGGKLPKPDPAISSQFSRVNRMHGSRDLDKVSSSAAAPGVAPWPGAGKSKNAPLYDQNVVREALTQPRSQKDIRPQDPRQLHATQTGLTRGGVGHYMSDEYAQTGRMHADGSNVGNVNPVMYHKKDGRSLILSGHHRAGAALLQGKQFDAQHVFGD